MRRRTTRIGRNTLALLAFVAVAAAACTGDDATPDATPDAAQTTTGTSEPPTTPGTGTPSTTATSVPGASTVAGAPRALAPFAAVDWVPLLDDAAPFAGAPTPSSLDEVEMSDHRRLRLATSGADVEARIEQNGFAVVPIGFAGYRFFHDAYEAAAYDYSTVFVSTDVGYHVWHQVFDKVLRDTEEEVLAPELAELLTSLVAAARVQAGELAGTELADPARRAAAFYEAAAVLLGVDVGDIDPLADEAVTLATDAATATTSPITGVVECALPESFVGCVDYTLMRPRGHYTRSEALERYFRSMSMLGLEAFYVDDPATMQIGMFVTRVLTEDAALLARWQTIYDTTAFLVGVADDYTPLEVADAAADVLGDGLTRPDAFTPAAASSLGEALLAGREVGIDPENASVRVMGARLVLDAFILDQLAWPNVGTEDARRVHVSALDLAAAFGSPLAQRLQAEAGEGDYLAYDDQMAAMQRVVADRGPTGWSGTVYDAWLSALEPQFAPRSAAYPDLMRTDAWAAKSLQTGLGSYTELKHDTVLYAKQGTAAEGEDVLTPFDPRHYVEPDPVTFGRLAVAATLCRDGLAARGLLGDEAAVLLDAAVELLSWLGGIAADELAGVATSDADNERLGRIGRELELLWYETSDIPLDSVVIPAVDDGDPLVVDVFRSSFEYLELATGWIDPIFVIVPDGRGGFQLAQGGVYSYYEFWRSVDLPRLTDEEWRLVLDTEDRPPRPAWQAPFLVGEEVATTTPVVQP